MSKPPRFKDVIWEVPEEGFGWFRKGLSQLSSFMNDTALGLDKKLNRAENFQSQRYDLTLQTGSTVDASFPLRFNCTLGAVPESVVVGQIRVLEPGTGTVASAPGVWWDLDEGSVIKINKIFGLNASTKYQITLLVT